MGAASGKTGTSAGTGPTATTDTSSKTDTTATSSKTETTATAGAAATAGTSGTAASGTAPHPAPDETSTVPATPAPDVSTPRPDATPTKRKHNKRKVLALALLVAILAIAAVWVVPQLIGMAVSAVSGPSSSQGAPADQQAAPPVAAPPPRPQLPLGGYEIFPNYRVVAYYGTPGNKNMGVLGIGAPEEMADKLDQAAAPFVTPGKTVQPTMELIVHVADGAPGPDGNYSHAINEEMAYQYLAVARAHRQMLVIDIQPGSSDFQTVTAPWERLLREPDVGLALDPEWRMAPGEVPGKVIGSVTADEINVTARWLADIVRTSNLPQKLFVVHQFTPQMITNPERLETPRELAVVQHVDGFGAPPAKIGKYQQLEHPNLWHGFKLFYTEDTPMLTPQQTLGLGPVPDFVTYQ